MQMGPKELGHARERGFALSESIHIDPEVVSSELKERI